jgi:hypothetical protein
VYFGAVDPHSGVEIERRIIVTGPNGVVPRILSVAIPDGWISHSIVSDSTEAGCIIILRLTPKGLSGPIYTEMTIELDDAKAPLLRVPVAAVVKS